MRREGKTGNRAQSGEGRREVLGNKPGGVEAEKTIGEKKGGKDFGC